jgi:hypothetical protein
LIYGKHALGHSGQYRFASRQFEIRPLYHLPDPLGPVFHGSPKQLQLWRTVFGKFATGFERRIDEFLEPPYMQRPSPRNRIHESGASGAQGSQQRNDFEEGSVYAVRCQVWSKPKHAYHDQDDADE